MVSAEWVLNFAAGAAVSALFAPGAFQQSGFLIASLVTATSFVFSLVSLVAYARLTLVAQKAVAAIADGSVVSTHATGDVKQQHSIRWKALTWNHKAALPTKESTSPRRKQQSSPSRQSQTIVTPSAAFLVDFFGGFTPLTWLFEAVQQVDTMISYLLKVVAVVDLFTMFLLDPSNADAALSVLLRGVHQRLCDALGFDVVNMFPMLAAPHGIATCVFLGVAVVILLPSPQTTRWTAILCDLLILALNVFLCAVLAVRVSEQFQNHLVARPEEHASLQYTPWQRFYFSYVAILTSFMPHSNTLAAFTMPALSDAAQFGKRLSTQIKALLVQFVYFMVLGVAVDIVMPPQRASSRIPVVVFNFVDYRTWLPMDTADSAERTPAAVVALAFSLVPIAHLLSAARGLSQGGPAQFERLFQMKRWTLMPFSLIRVMWVLVLTLAAVTLRPVNVLIVCKCVVHAVYIVLYLLVSAPSAGSSPSDENAARIEPRKRGTALTEGKNQKKLPSSPSSPSASLVSHRRFTHAATHSLIGKLLLGSDDAANAACSDYWWHGVSFGGAFRLLDRRPVYYVALAYWITCLLGWI